MKVLVVSDHVLLGQSLVAMLQSVLTDDALEVSHCMREHADERARRWMADLVLVDATHDFEAGTAMVRAVRGSSPEALVVVLGGPESDDCILAAVSAGADGYLPSDTSLQKLASTVQGVLRGELGLTRTAALRVVRRLRGEARPQSAYPDADLEQTLTRREQQIFDLVRRGHRSREISKHLCIAESTVYKHIQNIRAKLQLQTRTQAMFAVPPPSEQSRHETKRPAAPVPAERAPGVPAQSASRADDARATPAAGSRPARQRHETSPARVVH
jgi:DNA-binding NarL/FixJ family response regulator